MNITITSTYITSSLQPFEKENESVTDTLAAITQLQTQQALQTQAFINALEGRWVGADSVEAIILALNPALAGTLSPDPPVLSSGEVPKA